MTGPETITIALPGPVLATREGTRAKLANAVAAIESGAFVRLDFAAVEVATGGALDETFKTLAEGRWVPVGMKPDVAETWIAVLDHRGKRR